MWRENEKTLRRLFTSHYHPLRLTSVLHLHHTFYSAYPLSFFIPPSSSSFSRFFSAPSSHCSFPQRSASTHILWLQNAGDNEVSGKRGLGGVAGIIPVV